MLTTHFISRLRACAQMVLAAVALAGLCGCASLMFNSTRQARFIDMDGKVVQVDYGKEKRTQTMPNGLVCTFEGKVRLKLPEGKRIVLYQALSTSGVRYVSANKQYEFIEMGPYCTISLNGKMMFEGFFCRK